MKNTTLISLLAITLLLCAPATEAMHQRKTVTSESSSSTVAPTTAISPYEQLEQLKKQLSECNATIERKTDEWSHEGPCSCMKGTTCKLIASTPGTLCCANLFVSFLKDARPEGLDQHAASLGCTPGTMFAWTLAGLVTTASYWICLSSKEDAVTKADREARDRLQTQINAASTEISAAEYTAWTKFKAKKVAQLCNKAE